MGTYRAHSDGNCVIFGKNAHDSGNDTWERTLQKNAFCVISKTRNNVSTFCLSVWLDARPQVCRSSIGFLGELVPYAVPCKVYHLYLLLIWSIVGSPKTPWLFSRDSGLSFPFRPFLLGLKAFKLLSQTFALQKRGLDWNDMSDLGFSVSYKSVKCASWESTMRILFPFPIFHRQNKDTNQRERRPRLFCGGSEKNRLDHDVLTNGCFNFFF